MPRLSYGKKPNVIELRFDHPLLDAEKDRFDSAVKTIMSVGGISKGGAIAFLEHQWYCPFSPGARRSGGPKPTPLNERVLQRMREMRKEGKSEAKVVEGVLHEIENEGLIGPVMPKKPKGLSEHTLKRRYVPVVFEWPEAKWVMKITGAGNRSSTGKRR